MSELVVRRANYQLPSDRAALCGLLDHYAQDPMGGGAPIAPQALARLCDASTIAYVACDDPADEHYAELQAMQKELQAFRTAAGQPA